MSTATLVCHECDHLQRLEHVPAGSRAKCIRCGALLHRGVERSVERTLALTLTSLILFVVANAFPFLSIVIAGNVTQITVLTGVVDLYMQNYLPLAALVLFTIFLAPLYRLILLLYILLPLYFGRIAPGTRAALRTYHHTLEWVIIDIFMIGVIVTVIKLLDTGDLIPGPGFWALAGLVVTMAAGAYTLDLHAVWERLGRANKYDRPSERTRAVSCHDCHNAYLLEPLRRGLRACCARCGADLHFRKSRSIEKTWALALTALMLYVPANVLPVTTVTSLGNTQSDTIMSGVIYLALHGDWPIALLLFIASVLVPLVKILILILLLVSVRLGMTRRLVDRTRLFRVTNMMGRWSMVDVYVVMLLVALVKLGNFATIEAGLGCLFFAGVVVVSILAYASFDSRLIWDEAASQQNA